MVGGSPALALPLAPAAPTPSVVAQVLAKHGVAAKPPSMPKVAKVSAPAPAVADDAKASMDKVKEMA